MFTAHLRFGFCVSVTSVCCGKLGFAFCRVGVMRDFGDVELSLGCLILGVLLGWGYYLRF